jgi:hypothetical protein
LSFILNFLQLLFFISLPVSLYQHLQKKTGQYTMPTLKGLLIVIIWILVIKLVESYRIGSGISDITGPVTQVMLMGYAVMGQTGEGILQRLWSRAFIVEDDHQNRVVFVNTDTQSMGDIIKKRVVENLQKKYGSVYTEKNVMISSTHSHSGMGGYLQYSKYKTQNITAHSIKHYSKFPYFCFGYNSTV